MNPPTRQEAIAMVEALRAGIPTRLTTRFLPDIRGKIVEHLQQDWQQTERLWPEGQVVWGSYGQGKTHLLTQLENLALDQGFATSRIALSKGVAGARLDALYAKLMEHLRTPNSTQLGIQHLLCAPNREWLNNVLRQQPDRYPHPLPVLVLEVFFEAEPEDQERLYGDLAGERLPIAELRRIYKSCRQQNLAPWPEKFNPKRHFGAYFGLMADTLKALGYRGWIVLLDELEVIGRLSATARAQAYLNLDWLLNWSQRMSYPIYTVGAAATTLENDVFESGREDKYKLLEKLKLETAEKECLERFFERITDKERCKSLLDVRPEEVNKILQEVEKVYRLAWPDLPESTRAIEKAQDIPGPLRTRIRALLEFLDIQRIYNEEADVRAGELMEVSVAEDAEFDEN